MGAYLASAYRIMALSRYRGSEDDMTTKPLKAQNAARRLPPLPDPPPRDMQQNTRFVMPGVPTMVALHFDAMLPGSTTLVNGYGYLCRRRSDLPRCPYPDMIVAFGVDAESINTTNGYVIEEVGKPPDLVLEVASSTTGRRDYIDKREIYANLEVPEYWRFDHSGGRYYDAPLACDLLTDGGYQVMTLTTEPDGVIWGYSKVLGLSVCWVEGRLRFWDRVQRRYLPYHSEDKARADAEAARADREAARVRELEEELRRRENP